MIDHQLLTRPIKPRSSAATRAVIETAASYLARRARPGVTYARLDGGLRVTVDGVDHLLVPSDGMLQIDAALRQLRLWGAVVR
jgi:hypothetical protein